MVSRGIPQLKNIRLYFCDFGGSSKGVRSALQDPKLAEFMKENEHLKLEVNMKRNFHPYMSSTYINGYVKDQSLKNMDPAEVIEWMSKVNGEYGRGALKHNSVKVNTERKSIQGGWTETMWNQWPKHLMENKKPIPERWIDKVPPRPLLEKKVRPHRQTSIARKKYVVLDRTDL